MIVARSAGWSSARPAWGTRSLIEAIERLDRVDVLPVDVPLRARGRRRLRASVRVRPLEPEPAQQARRADVDGDEAERALDLVEAEVVDPDDLAPVDVDDLLVQQVGPQQDLVRALLELVDVDASRCASLAPGRRRATRPTSRAGRCAAGRSRRRGR